MRPTTINFADMMLQKINNNAHVLTFLISFLQENDKQFKDFELVSNINLSVQLTTQEEKIFYTTLNECKNLPIEKIPTLETFKDMIINQGYSKEKFTIDIVKKLLKAVVFENKLTSALGLTAYKINNYNK